MSCQVIGLGYVARLLQEREAMLASWALSSTEKCRVLLPLFVFCPRDKEMRAGVGFCPEYGRRGGTNLPEKGRPSLLEDLSLSPLPSVEIRDSFVSSSAFQPARIHSASDHHSWGFLTPSLAMLMGFMTLLLAPEDGREKGGAEGSGGGGGGDSGSGVS